MVNKQWTLWDAVEWRQVLWFPAVQWALEQVGTLQGRCVLDVGCRYGGMATWFACQGARVYAVDKNRDALTHAIRRISKLGVRVQYSKCSAYQLPFADRKFDLVFTKSVLVVLNHRPALAEWWRVSKPGGRLVLLENMGGHLLQIYRTVTGTREGYHYLTLDNIERLGPPEFAEVKHKEFHLLATVLSFTVRARRYSASACPHGEGDSKS